jgi:cell division septal protein FtsQ
MSRVTAPSDRRFRRAHVKPARKRRSWTALVKPVLYVIVLGAVGAVALYRGSRLIAETRLLRVDRIIVHGNERLSKGEVLAVLSGLEGENLLLTDLDAWRRRLLMSPWVSDAALRRSLPSTVEVAISERTPIGIARLNGGEMYLVDERGVIIDQFGPQYVDFDLPIIDGLTGAPGSKATSGAAPEYSLTDESRAELATRVMAALRAKPQVAHRVSQVDVTDAHNASVILTGDPAVIELGDDQFLPRLQAYLDLASTLRDRVDNIDYVDLRFDDRIYVRPLKTAGTARAVPRIRKK